MVLLNKARVATTYNKKVKSKSFQIGDLVWQTILPIGTKSNQFGKWSPNWKGPYKVIRVMFANSYVLEVTSGEHLTKTINGRYLKNISQVFGKKTSALRTMADACIALRTKRADI
jgi:hypothetical protein